MSFSILKQIKKYYIIYMVNNMYNEEKKGLIGPIIVIVIVLIILGVGGYFLYNKFVSSIHVEEPKEEVVIDLTDFNEVNILEDNNAPVEVINQKNIYSKELMVDNNKLIVKFYQGELPKEETEEITEESKVEDLFIPILIDVDNDRKTILKGFMVAIAKSKDEYTIDMASKFFNDNIRVFKDYNNKEYLVIHSIEETSEKETIINPVDGKKIFSIAYDKINIDKMYTDLAEKLGIDLTTYRNEQILNGKDIYKYLNIKDGNLYFREIRIKDKKVIVKDTLIKELSDDLKNEYSNLIITNISE